MVGLANLRNRRSCPSRGVGGGFGGGEVGFVLSPSFSFVVIESFLTLLFGNWILLEQGRLDEDLPFIGRCQDRKRGKKVLVAFRVEGNTGEIQTKLQTVHSVVLARDITEIERGTTTLMKRSTLIIHNMDFINKLRPKV